MKTSDGPDYYLKRSPSRDLERLRRPFTVGLETRPVQTDN